MDPLLYLSKRNEGILRRFVCLIRISLGLVFFPTVTLSWVQNVEDLHSLTEMKINNGHNGK